MARMGGGGRNRSPCADEDAAKAFFRFVHLFRLEWAFSPANLSESLTSELGHPPNTNVSPFDAAFPGTLPVRAPP